MSKLHWPDPNLPPINLWTYPGHDMHEADFKLVLRKRISKFAYIQSMFSYATNGTPDYWISGPSSDLWLEVKVEKSIGGGVKPKLSALQKRWLDERYSEGRKVAVIVGISRTAAIWYGDGSWDRKKAKIEPLDDIITRIQELVCR